MRHCQSGNDIASVETIWTASGLTGSVCVRPMAQVEEMYMATLALDPLNVEVLSNFALLLHENLTATARAEQHLRSALRILPTHVASLSNLANILIEGDRMEEGRELLERAVKVNPQHSDSLNNLAVLVGFVDGDLLAAQVRWTDAACRCCVDAAFVFSESRAVDDVVGRFVCMRLDRVAMDVSATHRTVP